MVARVSALFILYSSLAFTPPASAQGTCEAQANPPQFPRHHIGRADVTIFWPRNFPGGTAAMEWARDQWNSVCDSSGHVPTLSLVQSKHRPPGATEEDSIRLRFRNGLAPHDDEHGTRLAQWDPNANEIEVFGRLRLPGSSRPLSINWADPRMWPSIAHEIGHALGVYHDGCTDSVMVPGVISDTAEVRPEHCEVVDRENDPDPPEPPGPPGGVDPMDRLRRVCEFIPILCVNPGGPRPILNTWWNVSETQPTCTTSVITVIVPCCSERRETQCSYPTLGSAPPLYPLLSIGPTIHVAQPAGAVPPTQLQIQGWAADAVYGVREIKAWLDDDPTTLRDLTMRLPHPAACRQVADPDCPNVGFTAEVDLTGIPAGNHTLQVVAVNRRSFLPMPSVVSIPITVDAGGSCGDTVRPSVNITAPSAGATVSGAVEISATASDNQGVAHVDFYIDGRNHFADYTAPYSFTWPSGTVPDGAHVLTAKAFDACGNFRYSSGVAVTTANQSSNLPDIALVDVASGSAVPAGSLVDLGQVDPGIGTAKRFRIENAGQAPLTIHNGPSLVQGVCFQQTEAPAATVTAGGSTHFRARLLCPNAGFFSSTVSIASNDPDDDPYVFTLTGTVGTPAEPEIAVLKDIDSSAVPEGSTFQLRDAQVGSPVSTRFRLENNGFADLVLHQPTALVSDGCFSQIETPTTPIPPGGESWFRVRMLCPHAGVHSGLVTIASNDPDQSSYQFAVSGIVHPPDPAEIALFKDSNNLLLPTGSSLAMRDAQPGEAVSTRFRIENAGPGPLSIDNPGTFVSGPCFSLIEMPATPVPAGSATHFRVRFQCQNLGSYTGLLRIRNSDGDEDPYLVTLTGRVVE